MGWPGARRTYGQAACNPGLPVALHGSLRYGHGLGAMAIGSDPIGGVLPGFVKEVTALPLIGSSVASPLPVSRDPSVGAFVRDTGVSAAQISAAQQPGYVPAWAGDGRIGGLSIGVSPLGHLRPYHVRLEVRLRGFDPAGPLFPVLEEVR